MRVKAIVVGAVAALAMASLTANAGTPATRQVSGSLVSLVAATTTVFGLPTQVDLTALRAALTAVAAACADRD